MTRPTLAAALRAAHRQDLDDLAWLEGVTSALCRLRKSDLGAKAFFYSTDLHRPFSCEMGRDDVPRILTTDAQRYMTPSAMHYVYASEPRAEYGLTFLRDDKGDIAPKWRDLLAEVKAKDFFAFCVPDVGRGMQVAVLERNPKPLDPDHEVLMLGLSRQLVGQLRLRRLLADAQSEQLVFDSEGRCLHAEGQGRSLDTQARLRRLLRARDDAKQAMEAGQGLEGLGLWESVLAGEYCFVDQYDEGGRRRIIAMRTPPTVEALRRLSPVERKIVSYALRGEPNKVAALELDCAESTVAMHLGCALAKMGLPDRTALVRIYHSLAPLL